MFRFGRTSEKNLNTCEPKLIEVVERVMSFQVMDFSVIEGHRSLERQKLLFRRGFSKVDGIVVKGKHNYSPSKAVDLLPYPSHINGVNVWNDSYRFNVLTGLMFAAAAELNVKLRSGSDWDGDGNGVDQLFFDLPHYELKGEYS